MFCQQRSLDLESHFQFHANRMISRTILVLSLCLAIGAPIPAFAAGRRVKLSTIAKSAQKLPVGSRVKVGKTVLRVRKNRVVALTGRADGVLVRRVFKQGVRTEKKIRRPRQVKETTKLSRSRTRRAADFFLEPGNLRASLMGLSDGVASTFGLVAATTAMQTDGSEMTAGAVLLAGLAAMISGASSMASGEYSSVSYDNEQITSAKTRVETAVAKREPSSIRSAVVRAAEQAEVTPQRAKKIARILTKHPERLERYVRELGLDASTSSPRAAAGSSFVSFLAGASIPMVPILLGMTDNSAIAVSGTLSVGSLVAVGWGLSRLTDVSSVRSTFRLATAAALGAAISWVAGSIVGQTF